ncbi:MAG TPA: 3-phosphoglycerate dehydrogenase, partial [Verrucomicrobiae bacterium]|nr:3-phosphoglycerate dehydrogenase [Verrucomicrobiae bacterium]
MDILITEDLQAAAIERLEKKYKIVRDAALWKDAARLKAAIGEARCIMVRNQTQVSAELLGAAPKLIGIGRVGV